MLRIPAIVATILLFAVISPLDFVHANPTLPLVQTQQGQVRGITTAYSDVFFALPFAAAPVGELRWAPPKAAGSWQGIRAADKRPPMCMQAKLNFAVGPPPNIQPVSEDCLYLNVWRPIGIRAGADLPVMVWIHGGSYLFGSGGSPRFDGDFLTARDVVLVTINYRLGVFGTFAHPAIEAEQEGSARASYGLMDQVAALRWVQDNIGSFGGDKNNVTIFGNSAGGASVNILSVAEDARGLFHRAIAQSGGIRVEDTPYLNQQGVSPFATSLMDNGMQLAKDLGADDLASLRALKSEDILNWQIESSRGPYGPVIDGVMLKDMFAKPFVTGGLGEVDFMFGVDSWEASILEMIPIPAEVYLKSFVGVEEAREAYGNPSNEVLKRIMFEDKTFFAGARFLAKYAAKNNKRSFLYHFSYRPTAARGDGQPGAAHSDEVPYIFNQLPGTVSSRIPLTEKQITSEDRDMAALMADYWTNFAKHGDPNGEDLPEWPAYTIENDVWMDLAVEPKLLPAFRSQDMDFWETRFLEYLLQEQPD